MTELRKFNRWFNTTDMPGSIRPIMWAAWLEWLKSWGWEEGDDAA